MSTTRVQPEQEVGRCSARPELQSRAEMVDEEDHFEDEDLV
jgi:hypothetical protein